MTRDEFDKMEVFKGKKILVKIEAKLEIKAVDWEQGLIICADGRQYHYHDIEDSAA